jgi:PAS domain S-box-containing protein
MRAEAFWASSDLLLGKTSDLVSIATFSANPVYVFINPSYKNTLGYGPEDLIGKHALDLIHPKDREDLAPLLANYLEAKSVGPLPRSGRGITEKITFRLRDHWGSWRHLEATGDLLDDDHILFVSRDISERIRLQEELQKAKAYLERRVEGRTAELSRINAILLQEVAERKRAQEALQHSEQKFRELAELLPETIFEMDLEGKLTFVNQRAYAHFLCDQEDLNRGLNALHILTPEDRARGRENIERLLRGEKEDSNEYTALRRDGTTFPVMIRSSPIFKDGRVVGLRGFIVDITERKRVEEALRESEERYRQLFNHAPAGIYELDFEKQKWVTVNDVMWEYTGYTKEEFLATSPYDFLDGESKALFSERMRKMADGEAVSGAVEYKIRAKGGREFWVAVNTRSVHKNGKVKGVTAVVHDISKRKRAEEALKQSEDRLRSLSSELMKAHENERLRISKELHDELGQSLAILKHRVRSIQKKIPENLSPLHHDCEEVNRCVDQIIDNIRRLSRDLSPSILEDLGLSSALRWLVENFREQYSIPVSFDVDDIDGFFTQESQRNLYRISQEALTNIGKHAEAGHVAFVVKKTEEDISFLIEDDGKGFKPGKVKGKRSSHKGLGLAVMEERAHMLRGSLVIKSRTGRGTRVLLTIPMEKRGLK